jgi:hypothetical protein
MGEHTVALRGVQAAERLARVAAKPGSWHRSLEVAWRNLVATRASGNAFVQQGSASSVVKGLLGDREAATEPLAPETWAKRAECAC